ncbi:hypothetical protein B296_00051685 [Ensete ventricosum]|uniref:Uncharacterized protein n=1 Tax=Ensete ventricosum TaxID=4639 RepID=A0A426Y5C1_ENSVE|nr:hypothetical protein B296_00051685 [Ensete ventricosum]
MYSVHRMHTLAYAVSRDEACYLVHHATGRIGFVPQDLGVQFIDNVLRIVGDILQRRQPLLLLCIGEHGLKSPATSAQAFQAPALRPVQLRLVDTPSACLDLDQERDTPFRAYPLKQSMGVEDSSPSRWAGFERPAIGSNQKSLSSSCSSGGTE